MKVTSSTYNQIIRHRSFDGNPLHRSISRHFSFRRAALNLLHREGYSAAVAYLDSKHKPIRARGNPSQIGLTNSTDALFARYVEMDRAADLKFVRSGLRSIVGLGSHSVGANVTCVFENKHGHFVGRIVFWDKQEFDPAHSRQLALPEIRALQETFSASLTSGVDVWHVASGTQAFVAANDAISTTTSVEELLDSIEEDLEEAA